MQNSVRGLLLVGTRSLICQLLATSYHFSLPSRIFENPDLGEHLASAALRATVPGALASFTSSFALWSRSLVTTLHSPVLAYSWQKVSSESPQIQEIGEGYTQVANLSGFQSIKLLAYQCAGIPR